MFRTPYKFSLFLTCEWGKKKRKCCNIATMTSLWRHFSSDALSAVKTTSLIGGKVQKSEADLKIRILKLVVPRRSATTVLQNWVDEGRRVSVSQLRSISRLLLKRRRFKHALEVLNSLTIISFCFVKFECA